MNHISLRRLDLNRWWTLKFWVWHWSLDPVSLFTTVSQAIKKSFLSRIHLKIFKSWYFRYSMTVWRWFLQFLVAFLVKLNFLWVFLTFEVMPLRGSLWLGTNIMLVMGGPHQNIGVQTSKMCILLCTLKSTQSCHQFFVILYRCHHFHSHKSFCPLESPSSNRLDLFQCA